MDRKELLIKSPQEVIPFYERHGVIKEIIPIREGIPLGIEQVFNPEVGIGGVYGAWGRAYDNQELFDFIEEHVGKPLEGDQIMDLSSLGFDSRHHIGKLTKAENIEVEVEVGKRMLEEAAWANEWDPGEVDAVLVGESGSVCDDYTQRIASLAGISARALKFSVHKACASSTDALHIVLNRELGVHEQIGFNLAEKLEGKKVLVGGIEGLSRFMHQTQDVTAKQLFGNGAGIIGVIPGENMEFLVGGEQEVFDENGVLQVRMDYPHSGNRKDGRTMVEVYKEGENHIQISGLMHEPEGVVSVHMAGPMGMVKLFVRNGVDVVKKVYVAYEQLMEESGSLGRDIKVVIAHHANLKINSLKGKMLRASGIEVPIPWVIRDFGNVSAASNMIAFLRELKDLNSGDHVMFDGFGAGTYYDCLVVEMGGK